MGVTRILDGLEASDAAGAEADAVARLGFLEWIFATPDSVTPAMVARALDSPAARNAASPAAQAFVAVLRQAHGTTLCPPVRRRRRAPAVH